MSSETITRIDELERELARHALAFRSSSEGSAERDEAIANYHRVLKSLMETGNWCGTPDLDNQLPDEFMPQFYKDYWSEADQSRGENNTVDQSDDQSIEAERQYARRKEEEHQAYEQKRQQSETLRAQEERWNEGWQRLESALQEWATACNGESIIKVADAVVNLGRDIQEMGFDENVRLAVSRLDRLCKNDPTGRSIHLCDLPVSRIICRWILQVLEGAKTTDIAKRVEHLPASADFAVWADRAAFEIMHARGLTRGDKLDPPKTGERSDNELVKENAGIDMAAKLGLCSYAEQSDAAGRALINWLSANDDLTYERARDLSVDEAINIARRFLQSVNTQGEIRVNTCHVLFFAANPSGTGRLALDEEVREIETKIRAAEHRDNLKLLSKWAVRPDDLLQALNQHNARIVHFSGHGSPSEEIILTNDQGEAKPVSKSALSALFKTLRGDIRLVILNACFSRPQAEAITEHIDCAIGMSKAIGDKAAIKFAASVYRAIGFGKSVQDAFDQGITALLLEGIPEENTPQLLCRKGVDPQSVQLLNP